MNMEKFSGAGFVSLADLANGPIEATIVGVSLGKFERPVLTIGSDDGALDGAQISLNKGNVSRLIRIFGGESSAWIDRRFEMSIGRAKNQQGEEIDSVVTRGLGPRSTAATVQTVKPNNTDMNDDIPF